MRGVFEGSALPNSAEFLSLYVLLGLGVASLPAITLNPKLKTLNPNL